MIADSRLAEPIELPTPPESTARRPFPLVASIVPVIGAIVMWRVMGSVHMLWFAALGPLMAIASLADGARGARRARRRAMRDLRDACEAASVEVSERHERERVLRRASAPDVARALASDGALWRRRGAIVLGTGDAESEVSIAGGEGDEADRLRERARVLRDAPVEADWRRGVCVRGDAVIARAVARALVAQLVVRHPPSAVHLVAPPFGEEWAEALPHRRRRSDAAVAVAAVAADEPIPSEADAAIVWGEHGATVPAECDVVLDVGPGLGGIVVDARGSHPVACEAIGLAQCRAIAEQIGSGPAGDAGALTTRTVPLGEVRARDAQRRDDDARPAGLHAAVGVGPSVPDDPAPVVSLDLVSDGPHAVVVGTTGAGKSEMLTTWIASLASSHGPDELVLLLADFKGGTAFDGLRELPHVSGVLTDLDGAGAVRAVDGLRAEIRRRERLIAGAGARDVSDPRVGLARLVIVVDEFAALLQEHPDLHAVFTDVAARGRALGMHLVLGSQRAAGVMRDALVANSPLRIALRVAEPTESRAIVGVDDAAAIPGDATHRGVGLVRRAGDDRAHSVRFALSAAADITRAARAWEGVGPAAGPLLAALPDVWHPRGDAEGQGVVIGLADDPAEQRQPQVRLRVGSDRGIVAIGGAASGKSAFAAWVAHAARAEGHDVVAVPRDREGAWDALERAELEPPQLFVVDDADALLSRFPQEHAQRAGERLETIVRDAGATGTTVVLTAARLTGSLARVAELVPRRAVLALPTRMEHTAAGADGAAFDPERPPGRAVLDRLETQLAFDPSIAMPGEGPLPSRDPWRPAEGVAALVLRASARRAETLRATWGDAVRIVPLDEVAPGASFSPDGDPRPVALVGDPEAWQRHVPLLRQARSSGGAVVGADCPTELRSLLGEREVPPYARPRAARAWLVHADSSPRRIVLP